MLRSAKDLTGYSLRAVEGNIGKVKDFLFDDQEWGIRYLVADTGGWLKSHKVVISPQQLMQPETEVEGNSIRVSLTKAMVEGSPLLEQHQPVSRRYEREFARFHNLRPYWDGAKVMGADDSTPLTNQEIEDHRKQLEQIEECHVRSVDEIIGYRINSPDSDEVGRIKDAIVDTDDWKILYFVVDTNKWMPGRNVILNIDWISNLDWESKTAAVDLPKVEIENSPKFDPKVPVNRAYEEALYDFYGRPRYW